ncbi:MAG: Omp28-related outer membrane protein [Phaeodactylibacter sp.]|nr:Omp28-related outer membrane protein [Phaeodactylibacter sp.]
MKILNRYLFVLLLTLVLAFTARAQVAKTVIVEHFTNSKCSICANKNPGFYNNLNGQPDILHLAIHPSSPYSDCIFNQHNPVENDARTYFYNVYGSTPRLVIQGSVIPSTTSYSDPALWTPFLGAMSPVSIQVEQSKQSNLIQGRVTLQVEEAQTLGDLRLFVALAEDTVFYNAPNGEDLHFDVFRKALSEVGGDDITLPQNVGETATFEFEIIPDPMWDLDRMFMVVILQGATDKTVIQAAASTPDQNDVILGTTSVPQLENVQISPNSVQQELSISMPG